MIRKQIQLLNTVQNRIIVLLFTTITILYVCSFFYIIDTAWQTAITILSFIFAVLPALWKRKVEEKLPADSIADVNDFQIERESFYKQLIGKENTILLSGNSGSGKTVLVNQLKKELESNTSERVFIKNDGYYADAVETEYDGYSYVVFDQFERAVLSLNTLSWKQLICNLESKGVHVIIVTRKEYIGDLFKLMNRNLDTMILSNDDVADDKLQKILQDALGRIGTESTPVTVQNRIIRDFKDGRMTFIQFRVVCECIAACNIKRIDKGIDYDRMINTYMSDLIKESVNSDIALQILYLLSFDTSTCFEMKDFENITFASEEKCIAALRFLETKAWICKVSKREIHRNPLDKAEYKIAHDYFQERAREICSGLIPAETRNNIENYYYLYSKSQRSETVKTDFTTEQNKLYQTDKTNKRFVLHGFLSIFLMLYVLESLLYLRKTTLLMNPHAFEIALLQIPAMLSVIYVYNFYLRFLSLLGKGFYSILAICAFVDLACLYWNQYWGMFLGIGVIAVGMAFGFIQHLYLKGSKDRYFITRARNYFLMGLIIFYLGFIYHICAEKNLIYGVVFILLYIAYITATILSHINDSHFMMMIGKYKYHI